MALALSSSASYTCSPAARSAATQARCASKSGAYNVKVLVGVYT